jgi:hypothetical protein
MKRPYLVVLTAIETIFFLKLGQNRRRFFQVGESFRRFPQIGGGSVEPRKNFR